MEEKGSAIIIIELKNSRIEVYHGEDKTLLYEKEATEGDWDKIWSAIKK